MRNLKCSFAQLRHFPELENADRIVSCWGSDEEDQLHSSGCALVIKGSKIYRLVVENKECIEIFDLEEFVSRETENTSPIKVVGVTFDSILNAVIVCLESGEILSLVIDSTTGKANDANSRRFESKFKLMEFSPDLEIGICLTDEGSLLVISAEFQVLKQVNLFESGEAEQKFVNVGWGKKETQFHGSEGKQAAVAPPPSVNESLVHDEHTTSVTWRGDSAMFAVGYWCRNENMRKVKIFNKEGVLQRVGENLPGLEDPMAWRPTGNITLTQMLPNKYVISFMEKNGLKHHEFCLPNNVKVERLLWNQNSSILCTVCEEKESKEKTLMFWTTGNYHWYLKQKISMKSSPVCLAWDTSKANKLHGICKDGFCFILQWTWFVNRSDGCVPEDPAYVGVIDNNKILLTSFQKAIIPPPMSEFSLICPSAVNRILFSSNSESFKKEDYCLCAVLDNGNLALFSESVELKGVFEVKWKESIPYILPVSMNHWIWVKPDYFIVIGTTRKNNSAICSVKISTENVVTRFITQILGVVVASTRYQNDVVMETSDGEVFIFDILNNSIYPRVSLPSPCLDLECNDLGVFARTEHNRLFMNEHQIASNVSSFIVHDPYILASTTTHQLLILFPDDILDEVASRKIERGSKLVVSTGTSVIMQLPRGNLETIQPRALTILSAGQLLDQKKYGEAMILLRRQRIDLNLCVDHNPKQFLEDVDIFIEQVDAEAITQLVTELAEYDTTKENYEPYYADENLDEKFEDKVAEISSTLYAAMVVSPMKNDLMLPILSCLVKVNNIEKAIYMVKTDQDLKYLLFLVDVDRLYTEALAAYNLEAAMKVAGKSQKDPKEYIPYLNSLKEMEPLYMRYTIDKTMNKLESALAHIIQCSEERTDECLSFIQEHALFKRALQMMRQDEQSYRFEQTEAMYADYLFNRKSYEDAGVMYTRCGNIDKAIESHMKVGNWRHCMSLATKAEYDEQKMKEVATTICNSLKSLKMHSDAATVYLKYLSDIENAVECYVIAKKWQKAIYISETENNEDLLNNVVKNSLLETVDNLQEEIRRRDEKFNKLTTRLKVVREEKQKQRLAHNSGESSDSQSEASSSSSVRSSVTRSSKNTRKTERKMWSLKEGNPREEQALVASLNEFILSSQLLTGEVRTTNSALLYFKLDEEAYSLQTVMKALLNFIEKRKLFIWPKDPEGGDLDLHLKIPPPCSVYSGWELEIFKEGSRK